MGKRNGKKNEINRVLVARTWWLETKFHNIPYLPQLVIYYTPQTKRKVIGHFEGYLDLDGNMRHMVMAELDSDISWEKLREKLYNVIKIDNLLFVFKTRRGYHIYTTIFTYTWKDWKKYMKTLVKHKLVDIGWLRLAEWRHDKGWKCWAILRLSKKYEYNDFTCLFFRKPRNKAEWFIYWCKKYGCREGWKRWKENYHKLYT